MADQDGGEVLESLRKGRGTVSQPRIPTTGFCGHHTDPPVWDHAAEFSQDIEWACIVPPLAGAHFVARNAILHPVSRHAEECNEPEVVQQQG